MKACAGEKKKREREREGERVLINSDKSKSAVI